jgi:hypothetical protein
LEAIDLIDSGQSSAVIGDGKFDEGGTPQDRLSGKKDQMYWDTVNSRSYICTGATNWQEITG